MRKMYPFVLVTKWQFLFAVVVSRVLVSFLRLREEQIER